MKFPLVLSLLLLPLNAEELQTAPSLPDKKEEAYPALERFINVLETVRKRHPDMDKLAYDRLVNHALDGMLTSLDRHSSFIHPEMQQLFSSDGSINNQIPSLGLSIAKSDNGFLISAIENDGPAAKAGITPNSRLLKINGAPTDNLAPLSLLEILRRPAGEVTKLLIRNPERPGELEFSLTHRFVEQGSLNQANLLEKHPTIGYVRLVQFGQNCAREVEAALDELEDKGMTHLIIDLRGNGGGDLHETVKILGLLLPPGQSVVSVRERGKPEEFLKTPDRQRRRREYPVAVLIDQNSASASELTAGALHDLKRAAVIGEKSYGKGSVQNIIPMGNGTALRLTIATYHTPSGNTPHKIGIEPEIPVQISELDRENFNRAGRITALTEDQKAALSKWNDPVIKAAIEHLKKQPER
ncbi:MAG: S41 family peptidase [Akkermansiaceae bacterium]